MSASNQNIRVCARFRPQFPHETHQGGKVCVQILADKAALVTDQNRRTQFNFDRVFGPDCTQKMVYQETVGHMVDELLGGYNCTILAYGQTGSGKTFTMQGSETSKGLMPRLMKTLFERIAGFEVDVAFTVTLSYVEIYRGKIRDLLEVNSKKRKAQKLKIMHEMGSKGASGVYLEGAVETPVSDHEEVLYWIEFGAANREVKMTDMNPESSRSHGVVIVKIQAIAKNGSQKTAKLMMVDLAGSEAAKKTGATGETLEEAKAINGDLSHLGAVMNQLTSNRGGTPSYRSSKLTHLLSDSLGGNCKTTLIVCASESSYNAVETITTLRFGKSAKKVKNKAKVNEEKSVKEYKEEIQKLKKKVSSQKTVIAALKSDLNRALSGKITNLSECMFQRIQRGEKIVLKEEAEEVESGHRRSPTLESNGSTESKASNSMSESGASANALSSAGGHQRSLTNTSLGSIGENELIVSKDQYEEFCETLKRLGKVNSDFSDLKIENQAFQEKIVDRQAEIDELELTLEKESKKWTEKKIALRYRNSVLQRKNDDLVERMQTTTKHFEEIVADTERTHIQEVSTVRKIEQERVQRFIEEARSAIANDSRLSGNPNQLVASKEQRMKLLSTENAQLRQVFEERNVEYVEWKMRAFRLEQGVEHLRKKAHFQSNEIKLLAEAKKEASDIHYKNYRALERELKTKQRENTNLKKKVVELESCMDEEAAWIGKHTHAIRQQFRNMNMRIRPKKFQEANVLDLEIPQCSHVRAPSNVFTNMYTPDPTHVFRQPSMDFNTLPNVAVFTPPAAFPMNNFQEYSNFQNLQMPRYPSQNL